MAIRETPNGTVELGEPTVEPTDEHRKMCYVCNLPIKPGREKWERGEPVHGSCKQGWGI